VRAKDIEEDFVLWMIGMDVDYFDLESDFIQALGRTSAQA